MLWAWMPRDADWFVFSFSLKISLPFGSFGFRLNSMYRKAALFTRNRLSHSWYATYHCIFTSSRILIIRNINIKAAAYTCWLTMNSMVPAAFSRTESFALFFTQKVCLQSCKASRRIPKRIVRMTTMKYKPFSHSEHSVSAVSETACIIPSSFCPKKGRKRKIAMLQSSSPNTRLRSRFAVIGQSKFNSVQCAC